MTLFEFMALLCMAVGALFGAMLGSDYGLLAALGGFFAGGLLGGSTAPLLGFLGLWLMNLKTLLLRPFRKDSSDGGGGPPA